MDSRRALRSGLGRWTRGRLSCCDGRVSSLEIIQMEVGLIENFCEIIGCPNRGVAALVDPAFEVDRLLAAADEKGWRVETILLTHSHIDHINGLGEAAAATGAVVRCHPLEVDAASSQASRVEPVGDGEDIAVGEGTVRALYAPGHTAGCVCWHLPDDGILITGDVLFVGSCGGVTYPSSDVRAMYETLHRRIAALPEETRIYPGHDYGDKPTSTLAWELYSNPAFTAATLADFCRYKGVPVPE